VVKACVANLLRSEVDQVIGRRGRRRHCCGLHCRRTSGLARRHHRRRRAGRHVVTQADKLGPADRVVLHGGVRGVHGIADIVGRNGVVGLPVGAGAAHAVVTRVVLRFLDGVCWKREHIRIKRR
jgi:hypothetical protein